MCTQCGVDLSKVAEITINFNGVELQKQHVRLFLFLYIKVKKRISVSICAALVALSYFNNTIIDARK